ncbi:MAG: hypothetical protein Q4C41_03480 [Eggerthellaceae bacterium]|nr:hypothetical protein [Eggerthellaceae bacterium]
MTNVLQRKRSLSELEFYANAIRIRVEVTRLMTRERIVPKKYRLILAVPTIATAKAMIDNIATAESFYRNTAHGVIWRKHYLTLAIGNCYGLAQDIQVLKDSGIGAHDLDEFKELADMIEREIALLRGVKKSTRITGKSDVVERIAMARAQLAELEELQASELG